MGEAERRDSARIPALTRDEASIDPVLEDRPFEAVLAADMIDSSANGAGLIMSPPLVPEVGARFTVHVRGGAPRIAEVRWRKEQEDGRIRLGLQFVD